MRSYWLAHLLMRPPASLRITCLVACKAELSPYDRFAILENAEPILPNEEEFSILYISNEQMQKINTVYVIPGGGSSADHGYPEWTKRRVVAAHQHYENHHKDTGTAIFLALSAGSLNSANTLLNDKRVRFECQFTIQHLLQLGVPRKIIFGDTFSWDTVTNGLTLRMLVEGVQEYRAQSAHNFEEVPWSPPSPASATQLVLKDLTIEVFISDFHADRVRESFQWILNLAPAVRSTQLHINVVDSPLCLFSHLYPSPCFIIAYSHSHTLTVLRRSGRPRRDSNTTCAATSRKYSHSGNGSFLLSICLFCLFCFMLCVYINLLSNKNLYFLCLTRHTIVLHTSFKSHLHNKYSFAT
jgi:hypothetical protein